MCILEHFALGTIDIILTDGSILEHHALIYGNFAINPRIGLPGYTVSLVSCGRNHGNFKTLAQAARFVAFLNGLDIDFGVHNVNPAATSVELYGTEGARRGRVAMRYWRSRSDD